MLKQLVRDPNYKNIYKKEENRRMNVTCTSLQIARVPINFPLRGAERLMRLTDAHTAHVSPLICTYVNVIRHWLRHLQWTSLPAKQIPPGHDGISWTELAIDYEVFTGLDIPIWLDDIPAEELSTLFRL
eukprot:gene3188-1839_t